MATQAKSPEPIPALSAPAPDRLLNTKQASELLSIASATLAKWRKKICNVKGPKFIKLNGKTTRYRLSDLLEYIGSKAGRV